MLSVPGLELVDDGLRYAEHGINCFIVPKYLACGAFSAAKRELFYTYLYFYAHYDLPEAHGLPLRLPRQTEDTEALERYVLERKLGLELLTVEVGNDLCGQVRQLLSQGWPVLVPTNRSAYFYAESYGGAPLDHLLLVRGYDPSRELFLVLDGLQNFALLGALRAGGGAAQVGDCYSAWALPPALLEQVHRSYGQHFSYLKGQLMALRPAGAPAVGSGIEALRELAAQLEPYLEDPASLLEAKLAALSHPDNFRTEDELAFINSQQVLARMLPRLLPLEAASLGAELQEWGERTVGAWKKYATVLAVMLRTNRANPAGLAPFRAAVLEAERSYLRLIYRAAQALED